MFRIFTLTMLITTSGCAPEPRAVVDKMVRLSPHSMSPGAQRRLLAEVVAFEMRQDFDYRGWALCMLDRAKWSEAKRDCHPERFSYPQRRSSRSQTPVSQPTPCVI